MCGRDWSSDVCSSDLGVDEYGGVVLKIFSHWKVGNHRDLKPTVGSRSNVTTNQMP